MKIALSTGEEEEHLRFICDLGLRHVVSGAPASPDGVIPYDGLMRRRERYAAFGLEWEVIENLPAEHYVEAMFGRQGRDAQIDKVCRSIEHMGRASISVLQYQWMLLGGLRTEYSPTGRGGARYPRFDLEVAERAPAAALDWLGHGPYPHIPDGEISREQVRDNLAYFLERVVPAAEENNVYLAAHPDDAPVPSFMGVGRTLVDLDGLQAAVDAAPSDHNGLGFCMGTIGTMAGVDVVEAIRRFGGQKRIFFAHFRNPRGQVPRFDEVFPDEGDIDMLEAVRAFRDVGFEGVIRIDHCPGIIGDNARADRSFAFQVGYLQGLIRSVESLGL